MIQSANPAAIAQAAQALQAGQLVGLPTETVYGLAANASDDAAVAQIFVAKGRPADHPLIVHVASPEQVPLFAAQVPGFAQRLMQAFWPGRVWPRLRPRGKTRSVCVVLRTLWRKLCYKLACCWACKVSRPPAPTALAA